MPFEICVEIENCNFHLYHSVNQFASPHAAAVLDSEQNILFMRCHFCLQFNIMSAGFSCWWEFLLYYFFIFFFSSRLTTVYSSGCCFPVNLVIQFTQNCLQHISGICDAQAAQRLALCFTSTASPSPSQPKQRVWVWKLECSQVLSRTLI